MDLQLSPRRTHFPRTAFQRAGIDQIFLRLRAGDQASPSARKISSAKGWKKRKGPAVKKIVLILFFASQAVLAQNPPAAKPESEQHEFLITNFKTESGVTLPQAKVVYGTYGHLNAEKNNVVLLPSHYMANFHGYEWLIGADRALDASKLFLVATELFGNGRSSSPSNTPEPFHGPRFPVMTIRDNVEAGHRLLTEELKITHLRAIIGFSMGAEQAFQWAVSYPDFADRIVATS